MIFQFLWQLNSVTTSQPFLWPLWHAFQCAFGTSKHLGCRCRRYESFFCNSWPHIDVVGILLISTWSTTPHQISTRNLELSRNNAVYHSLLLSCGWNRSCCLITIICVVYESFREFFAILKHNKLVWKSKHVKIDQIRIHFAHSKNKHKDTMSPRFCCPCLLQWYWLMSFVVAIIDCPTKLMVEVEWFVVLKLDSSLISVFVLHLVSCCYTLGFNTGSNALNVDMGILT